MEAFGERMLFYLVVAVVSFAIALLWKYLHEKNTMRSRPAGEEREELLAKVNDLKKEGLSYQERKKHLLRLGLNRANAEEILGDAERQRQTPSTNAPITEHVQDRLEK